MFRFLKKIFIGLLTSIVSASYQTKCVSLNNQQCMTQSNLINLHPDEYIQGLNCYPFAVNLDICVGSFNFLDELSTECAFRNKSEDLNLSAFNMITRKNESKTLTKHISYKYKCKFDDGKNDSNQKRNNDERWCECKNLKKDILCWKKVIFGILLISYLIS